MRGDFYGSSLFNKDKMKRFLTLLCASMLLFACEKPEEVKPFIPVDKDNTESGSNGDKDENELPSPGEPKSMVVAHRGGSAEAGKRTHPDNSIAALRYAMGLGCYASECDIYWTKDNKVIVAHADGNYCINGLKPWEHTLEEIQKAGKLSNDEVIPSLEDYLKVVMGEGSCTKLWLDIKNIPDKSDEVIKACERSCEIIEEMKATNFVEFICTGNKTVWNKCFPTAKRYNIPNGWMRDQSALEYASNSIPWANLSIEYFAQIGTGTSDGRTIKEFVDNKVALSVFNADSDSQMNYFVREKDKLKAICTNYPSKLIDRLK